MGVLVDGTWRDGELPQETGVGGEFRRADSQFRDRIAADGSSIGSSASPRPRTTWSAGALSSRSTPEGGSDRGIRIIAMTA